MLGYFHFLPGKDPLCSSVKILWTVEFSLKFVEEKCKFKIVLLKFY